MTEVYPRPPLLEAIYEFFPANAPGWSQLSAARVAKAFEGESEELQDQTVRLPFGSAPLSPTVDVTPRHRLWMKRRTELFQFGPQICAYNVLADYTQFETRLDQIRLFFAAYVDEVRPEGIQWAGQRYINKIRIAQDADPASFFSLYPRLPTSGGHRPFALQIMADSFSAGEVLVNLSYRGVEDGSALYFLDVYAHSRPGLEPRAEPLVQWQQLAHEAVRKAFEDSVTDECRGMFRRKL